MTAAQQQLLALFAQYSMLIAQDSGEDVMTSSSDDDYLFGQEPARSRIPNRDRKRAMYARLLLEDYWGPNPIYAAEQFRTRFRMPLELFDIIEREVTLRNDFFVQKSDCTGLSGFTPKQKVACSIRMLTSGVSAEEIDDKFRMGKSTALLTLKQFCETVCEVFANSLREPNANDIDRLLDESKRQAWPGCLGSIDCMHWKWKNCPTAWSGQFKGKEGAPTIVLEAIADSNCRFWHFFFGVPGSLNDINVLQRQVFQCINLNDVTCCTKF